MVMIIIGVLEQGHLPTVKERIKKFGEEMEIVGLILKLSQANHFLTEERRLILFKHWASQEPEDTAR